MNQDLEHLRLLSIFHYILGGIMACIACIPLIHVAMGLLIIFSPAFFGGHGQNLSDNSPPVFIGWFFVILGGLFVFLGWVIAVLTVLAGRNLARQRCHTFCFVVACLLCVAMPFGTVLGVFTILVLNRNTVKTLFTNSATP